MEGMEEDAVSTLQHENSSLLELYMTFQMFKNKGKKYNILNNYVF